MSDEARQLRVKAEYMIREAQQICDHKDHRHDYDSDGPGYTCNDCGEYGYGSCGFCAAEKSTLDQFLTWAKEKGEEPMRSTIMTATTTQPVRGERR